MSSDWMAIQSFHRGQELLTAINELSIHLKLEAAGVADEQQTARAEEGRNKLLEFLRRLQPLIEAAEEKGKEPVTGADTRMRQLAEKLVEARRSTARGKSPLLRKSMSKTIELLESHHDRGLCHKAPEFEPPAQKGILVPSILILQVRGRPAHTPHSEPGAHDSPCRRRIRKLGIHRCSLLQINTFADPAEAGRQTSLGWLSELE